MNASAVTVSAGGANLRAYPGGEVVTWLPYDTPVQILETTKIDGRTWAHAILPDERSGWVAHHLLDTSTP
ncbi:MAG: SH3 domain-containing protein [Anaerolineales bacterium]|nr:SH3 domain-containing protein [Anaerolineales bacterium]